MYKSREKRLCSRFLAVLLSATMVFTFMPFLERPAKAAAGEIASPGNISEESIPKSFDREVVVKGESLLNGSSGLNSKLNGAYGASSYKDILEVKTLKMNGNKLSFDLRIKDQYKSGDEVYAFAGMMIDGEIKLADSLYFQISDSEDMSYLGTGYHSILFIVAVSKNGGEWQTADENHQVLYDAKVNTLTSKPSYKGKYTVYTKSLYIYPYSNLFSNSGGDLYLEYRVKGSKTWKRSSAMRCNAIQLALQQNWRIKKLKPNKVYLTRLRYGEWVTYDKDKGGDGKDYFFGGPALKSTTLKTGKKNKPSIKSANVKVYSVKYHKVRHPGHYEWVGNVLIWRSAWTEKFYTYKVRVTVKLKKKTGAKGLWISTKFGSKYCKGNKKTYVAKFNPYPNYRVKRPPKGLGSTVVKVRSYETKAWGGYSPIAKKKKKVR